MGKGAEQQTDKNQGRNNTSVVKPWGQWSSTRKMRKCVSRRKLRPKAAKSKCLWEPRLKKSCIVMRNNINLMEELWIITFCSAESMYFDTFRQFKQPWDETCTDLYMSASYIRSMTHARCLIWWHLDGEMSAQGSRGCSSLACRGLSAGTTGGLDLATKPSEPSVTCWLFVRTQCELHCTLPWWHHSCAAGSDWHSICVCRSGWERKKQQAKMRSWPFGSPVISGMSKVWDV